MSTVWQMFLHTSGFLLVAALAWSVGGRSRPHRVVAAVFALWLVAIVASEAIAIVLDPAEPPYRGWIRVLYYLDHAIHLVMHFALLGACALHFANVRLRLTALGFGVTFVALIFYKEWTGASLLPFHSGVTTVTVALCWACIAFAVLAPVRRFVPPDAAHATWT